MNIELQIRDLKIVVNLGTIWPRKPSKISLELSHCYVLLENRPTKLQAVIEPSTLHRNDFSS
jgi:hypothetical protein